MSKTFPGSVFADFIMIENKYTVMKQFDSYCFLQKTVADKNWKKNFILYYYLLSKSNQKRKTIKKQQINKIRENS